MKSILLFFRAIKEAYKNLNKEKLEAKADIQEVVNEYKKLNNLCIKLKSLDEHIVDCYPYMKDFLGDHLQIISDEINYGVRDYKIEDNIIKYHLRGNTCKEYGLLKWIKEEAEQIGGYATSMKYQYDKHKYDEVIENYNWVMERIKNFKDELKGIKNKSSK